MTILSCLSCGEMDGADEKGADVGSKKLAGELKSRRCKKIAMSGWGRGVVGGTISGGWVYLDS